MKKHDYLRIFTDFLPNPSVWTKKISHLRITQSRLKPIIKVFYKRKISWAHIHLPVKIFLLTHLFLSFLFLSFFISQLQKVNQVMIHKREETKKLFSYWETIAKLHPTYPDAFYQAAWYSYVVGERQTAFELLEKALTLDPDFAKAKELREKILGNN